MCCEFASKFDNLSITTLDGRKQSDDFCSMSMVQYQTKLQEWELGWEAMWHSQLFVRYSIMTQTSRSAFSLDGDLYIADRCHSGAYRLLSPMYVICLREFGVRAISKSALLCCSLCAKDWISDQRCFSHVVVKGAQSLWRSTPHTSSPSWPLPHSLTRKSHSWCWWQWYWCWCSPRVLKVTVWM